MYDVRCLRMHMYAGKHLTIHIADICILHVIAFICVRAFMAWLILMHSFLHMLLCGSGVGPHPGTHVVAPGRVFERPVSEEDQKGCSQKQHDTGLSLPWHG